MKKNGITIEEVIKAYVETRDQLDAEKKAFDEKTAGLKKIQKAREDWLNQQLHSQGGTAVKTQYGTTFFDTDERISIGNWEAFLQWVMTTQNFEALKKAASKTAVLELMGEDRSGEIPPGIDYSAAKVVRVRRA